MTKEELDKIKQDAKNEMTLKAYNGEKIYPHQAFDIGWNAAMEAIRSTTFVVIPAEANFGIPIMTQGLLKVMEDE